MWTQLTDRHGIALSWKLGQVGIVDSSHSPSLQAVREGNMLTIKSNDEEVQEAGTVKLGDARSTRTVKAATRMLRTCIRDYPTVRDGVVPDDEQLFLDLADANRVSCLLADSLPGHAVLSEAAAQRLRLIDLRRRFRREELRRDLALVASVLDSSGVPWVLLKGPVVARLYPEGIREYSDLDILLGGRELQRALDVLVARGCKPIDRDFDLLTEMCSGEISVASPNGSMLDLHWHPIHERRVRRHFAVDVDALLSRSRRIVLEGIPVPVLDPTDELMHLCLHGCLSGGERLLWAKDVDLVWRRGDWDEDALLARAASMRIGLPTALMLQTAKIQLGTPVPAALLRELAGSVIWLRAMRVVDQLRAGGVLWRWHGWLRLALRSTRATPAATAKETIREISYQTVLRNRRDPEKSWRRNGQPRERRAPHGDLASLRAQQGFFRAVLAELDAADPVQITS